MSKRSRSRTGAEAKLGDEPITSLALPVAALNALTIFCAQHEQPPTVGTVVKFSESYLLRRALGIGRGHLALLNAALAARGIAMARHSPNFAPPFPLLHNRRNVWLYEQSVATTPPPRKP